jgi:hypothetical protein
VWSRIENGLRLVNKKTIILKSSCSWKTVKSIHDIFHSSFDYEVVYTIIEVDILNMETLILYEKMATYDRYEVCDTLDVYIC